MDANPMAGRCTVDPTAAPLPEEWVALRDAAAAPFTRDEECALLAALFDAKPPQSSPAFIVFTGPPGSGKSSCRTAALEALGLEVDEVVVVDSDEMREFHHGWRALMQLRNAEGALIAFTDAQKLGSRACQAMKERLVTSAVQQRKHVMLTIVKQGKRDTLLELALQAGFTLHLVVIVTSLQHIVQRAELRARDTGRVTTPQTTDTLAAIVDNVAVLLPRVSGGVVVLDNSGTCGSPQLLLRAGSGSVVPVEHLRDVCRRGFGLS
eukprot:GGOE01042761.1.p1 GENE.GGOE01042761.1~~GGOE01042761.1.p1  ORF type:complete len:290 (+),score=66.16 GGOE01042761.1:78-872(+)